MRLGGARGPPGTEGVLSGIFAGRGLGCSLLFLGGLLDSVFAGEGGVKGFSFLMLALRPSEAKKLPGDFVTEGETAERLDELDDVAIIVDARDGPLRGAAANAG